MMWHLGRYLKLIKDFRAVAKLYLYSASSRENGGDLESAIFYIDL